MKLTPPALKHHRIPSDFVARFAGICSAPIKAVFSALRVILILVYVCEMQTSKASPFAFIKLNLPLPINTFSNWLSLE